MNSHSDPMQTQPISSIQPGSQGLAIESRVPSLDWPATQSEPRVSEGLAQAQICLRVDQVDLVFGSKPKKGFAGLDQGFSRDEIKEKTGQVVAVSGASFSVRRGEVLVLMGLSGSGKSSLLRCLNGMNGRGTGSLRGQVVFEDDNGNETDIGTCSRKRLREIRRHQISMVFQQFGLMPWRTVLQNVAYPIEIQGVSAKECRLRALEKLDLVGLADWKDSYPNQLSGGMQQRVGLARAFVTQAPILLMDEPFSALDPIHRKHLQDEVLELQKTLQKTIVFVSHDLSEAARIGNRIAVMQGGRILQIGTMQELTQNPSCSEVAAFTSH